MSCVFRRRLGQSVVLCAIVALALTFRIYKLGDFSLWADEFLSIEVASGHGYAHQFIPLNTVIDTPAVYSHIDSPGTWSNLFSSLRETNHPPLYYCALRVWCQLWRSNSDSVIRGLSVFFSILMILFAYDAVRSLHGQRAAFWSAATLAVAAPQIQYAQEGRSYAMLVCLMMACCAVLARIQIRGPTRPRIVALLLLTAGMLLTHYLAYLVVLALLLYVLIRMPPNTRRQTVIALLSAVAITLIIWGPMIIAQSQHAGHKLDWLHESRSGLLTRSALRIPRLAAAFFIDTGLHPPSSIYLAGVLFVLPAFFLRKCPSLLLWSLIMWIGVLAIAVGDLVRSAGALNVVRYVLPAAAAANVLIVVILSELLPRWRNLAPAVVVLACAMTLPLSYDRCKPDWRAFAHYIDSNCPASATLVIYSPDPNYGQVVSLALSHYSTSWTRPLVIMTRPAEGQLLSDLRRRTLIDAIAYSTPVERYLPGASTSELESFPFLGCCGPAHFAAPVQTASAIAVRQPPRRLAMVPLFIFPRPPMARLLLRARTSQVG